jgi:hypothetical protein
MGNTLRDMKPDGTDLRTTKIRNEILSRFNRGDGRNLAPDGKSIALVRITKRLGGDDLQSAMEIVPVSADGKTVPLVGYVPRGLIGFDGKKAYFYGTKADGNEWNEVTRKGAACFALDAATGAVTKLPIPDGSVLFARTPDGRRMIYASQNGESYFTASDANGLVKLLDPKQEMSRLALSPDGDRLVAWVFTYDSVKEIHGTTSLIGRHSEKAVLIDMATRKQMELKESPKEEYVRSVRWNPAGTKIAYVWSRHVGEAPGGRIVQPGDLNHDVKIVVADPDGSNAKVVFETTTDDPFHDFLWN